MKAKAARRLAVLALVLGLSACSDFLTEDPRSSLTSESLGTSKEGLVAVVLGLQNSAYEISYARRRDNWLVTTATTDDMMVRSSRLDRQEMDTYTFGPDNQYIESVWQEHYQGIARINDAIALAQNATIEDEAFKAAIEAEARFFRAFFYHDLVRLFGPVPLITDPYDPTAGIPTYTRAPEGEVFALIKEDLAFATQNLPPERTPEERGRPGQDAARLLLARAHLTLGEYAEAAEAARAIVEGGLWSLHPVYYDLFNGQGEGSTESILELVIGETSNGSVRNEFGINNANLPTRYNQRTYRNFPMNPELAELFEENDTRRESFLYGEFVNLATDSVMTTVDGLPWTSKYVDPTAPPGVDLRVNNFVNWQTMRYAEVLLVLAEAVGEVSGPTDEAYAALNEVRARAGLDGLSGLSQEAFREAVRLERRKELHFEGFRWYDLKRWGTLEEAVEAARASNTYDQYPDVDPSKHLLFPIPNSEIATTGLDQNPGY